MRIAQERVEIARALPREHAALVVEDVFVDLFGVFSPIDTAS